jgi:flagellar basal body-associated protein FliL
MKKILIIGGIALVLIVGGVIAFFMLSGSGEDKVEELPELKYAVAEQYVNIPVGGEDASTKILKIQVTIVYTDESYTADVFPMKEDEIQDFINGYFRDSSLETVNRKNGKERVKEEITEGLRELLETDADNIKGVLMPQFIIQ